MFRFEPEIDLSIIIVNYNVRDLLRKCLKSILSFQKDLSFEVMVIDNNSEDQSTEMINLESGHRVYPGRNNGDGEVHGFPYPSRNLRSQDDRLPREGALLVPFLSFLPDSHLLGPIHLEPTLPPKSLVQEIPSKGLKSHRENPDRLGVRLLPSDKKRGV
jgi:hypothetical protein